MNNSQLQKTLALLFKTKDRQNIALKILQEIRDRETTNSPYHASERVGFSQKNSIKVSQYDDVLRVLKEAGLIAKGKGGEFSISYDFTFSLLRELLSFVRSIGKAGFKNA